MALGLSVSFPERGAGENTTKLRQFCEKRPLLPWQEAVMELLIKLTWDEKARVWIAESGDVQETQKRNRFW